MLGQSIELRNNATTCGVGVEGMEGVSQVGLESMGGGTPADGFQV